MEIIKAAGKYRLDRLDMHLLLVKAVSRYEAAFPNRNCRVNILPQPALPCILADGERISLVFQKILNYLDLCSSDDEINVFSARVGGQIKVTFRTFPKTVPQRFDVERFFQAGPSGGRFGLFVAERILSDHGGNLLVSADAPTGTTVSVTLPLNYRLLLSSQSNGRVGKARLVAE